MSIIGVGAFDEFAVPPIDPAGRHSYAVVSLLVGGDNGPDGVPQFRQRVLNVDTGAGGDGGLPGMDFRWRRGATDGSCWSCRMRQTMNEF